MKASWGRIFDRRVELGDDGHQSASPLGSAPDVLAVRANTTTGCIVEERGYRKACALAGSKTCSVHLRQCRASVTKRAVGEPSGGVRAGSAASGVALPAITDRIGLIDVECTECEGAPTAKAERIAKRPMKGPSLLCEGACSPILPQGESPIMGVCETEDGAREKLWPDAVAATLLSDLGAWEDGRIARLGHEIS